MLLKKTAPVRIIKETMPVDNLQYEHPSEKMLVIHKQGSVSDVESKLKELYKYFMSLTVAHKNIYI